MYLYACLREYKCFLVGTIVLREGGATLDFGADIHIGSFYAETPDCDLQHWQQTIFYHNSSRWLCISNIVCTIRYFNRWRGFRSAAGPVLFTESRVQSGVRVISDHRAALKAFRASMIAERSYLLRLLLILFHSCCSHAWVFGKTLAHEFLISYNHTEWYLFFFSERKSGNTCALVNL